VIPLAAAAHPLALLPPVSPTGRGAAAAAPKAREEIDMPLPKFITIDGKRHRWRDVIARRREQIAAATKSEQPALFELKEDRRAITERTAAGRYLEPLLFTLLDGEG
jgi:hypothetical protein